jgi:L-fuconolactonase
MAAFKMPGREMSISYGLLWNTFKRITAGFTRDEREQMFARTAAMVYGLDSLLPPG